MTANSDQADKKSTVGLKVETLDLERCFHDARVSGILGTVHIPDALKDELMWPYAKRNNGDFLRLATKLANEGSADAVAMLALLVYNDNIRTNVVRLKLSTELARIADWARNAYGTFVLGLVELESGQLRESLHAFEKSGRAGFPAASWFAGKMHEHGIGTHHSQETALEFYEISTGQDYLLADRSINALLRHGNFSFVTKSLAYLALPWYQTRFFIRNTFGARTKATHLLPKRGANALLRLIESRN